MKTSFVSSYATQHSMRLVVGRAQQEIQKLQTEVVTGRFEDIGVALGGKTSNAVMLHRDFEQFTTIKDVNALVENRLSAAQAGLKQNSESAQSMLEALILARDANNDTLRGVAVAKVKHALESFTDISNMTSNGEYLFAGINTDVKPVVDYFETGNTAKAAFDTAFSTHFGFAQSSPSVAGITSAQMQSFLDTVVEPMFTGAAWNTDWSTASDTNMTSRVAREELIQTSVNANQDGFRKFAFAATISFEMLNIGLNDEAQSVLTEKAIAFAGQAVTGTDDERAFLGISESRVTKANQLLQVQADLTKIYVSRMEEVDVYEASTRVNALMTQVETSYSITSRIQRLSLIDYLR
ncbi:flagellar hook-associated family protein [Lentilitoribacter sp. EG35]|uniref:flagellar hook-associated family protein n=1 Tax=Lentilitoribacter sp. EG35 TaxID=3234192 RepID=UPI00345FD9A2